MPATRVGVIGTGWGLMHVGAFRAAGADVVAIAGRDRARTEAIAAREGIAVASDDVRVVIDAADLVVVASPDALHASHVTLAAAAGKAVLCEKPVASSYAEAAALIAPRPTLTAIVLPYRQLPSFIAARRCLADRPARIVVTVRSGFPWSDASADRGGTSHILDAVCWLANAPLVASHARLRPDVSAFHLDFANGSFAAITFMAAPEPGIHGGWSIVGDGFELGFSAGYVPARGGWCLSPVRMYDGDWRDLSPSLAPQPNVPEPWAAAHHDLAREVLTALRGEPAELATFADGLRVHAILESRLPGRMA